MGKETDGIVDHPAALSVDEIVSRVQAILRAKGITLFALIDHSGEAAKVGLTMPPTKLLIFGNPKSGTPLMLASPSCAIDLPLKLLIWEDAAGKVWVSQNSVDYLMNRHHLPAELRQNISAIDALAHLAASPNSP